MVPCHNLQHLMDRAAQPNEYGTGNETVANIQLSKVRHRKELRQVGRRETVAGIDLET